MSSIDNGQMNGSSVAERSPQFRVLDRFSSRTALYSASPIYKSTLTGFLLHAEENPLLYGSQWGLYFQVYLTPTMNGFVREIEAFE